MRLTIFGACLLAASCSYFDGDKGDRGPQGEVGPRGPKGEKGDPGAPTLRNERPEDQPIEIPREDPTPTPTPIPTPVEEPEVVRIPVAEKAWVCVCHDKWHVKSIFTTMAGLDGEVVLHVGRCKINIGEGEHGTGHGTAYPELYKFCRTAYQGQG